MQTSSRVLVGCDGSWFSRRAVVAAAVEAARSGDELVVVDVPRPPSDEPAVAEALATAALGVALARERVPAVRSSAVAHPAGSPELDNLLASGRLLVLGGHGRDGQRVLSLDSTSAMLARRVGMPVMLVADEGPGPGVGEPGPVVVGLDGSTRSAPVLAYAAAQAELRGVELVVVRAVPPNTSDVPGSVARAEGACHEAVAALPHPPVRVTVTVRADATPNTLLSPCTPSALLVVGNRGVGRLQGPTPGSMTESLLRAAPCDVVLIPVPARSDSPTGDSLVDHA